MPIKRLGEHVPVDAGPMSSMSSRALHAFRMIERIDMTESDPNRAAQSHTMMQIVY